MAVKKFIVKQTVNWNTRGEKTSTHTVQMDESAIAGYIEKLDGKIEVFEQNLALSVDASTASTSYNTVERITITHNVLKAIYVSPSMGRPIVLKASSSANELEQYLENITPFDAPYSADKPLNVRVATGDVRFL